MVGNYVIKSIFYSFRVILIERPQTNLQLPVVQALYQEGALGGGARERIQDCPQSDDLRTRPFAPAELPSGPHFFLRVHHLKLSMQMNQFQMVCVPPPFK